VTERLARVEVPVAGRVYEVAGPRAELVALVAASDLSARTVRLLLAIAAEEERLRLIGYGSVTADLTLGQIRLHLAETRPRIDLTGRGVS
jgi:hypothetical protein